MATLFLNLTDGRIAYDDAGTGPLVLCLPGLGDLRGVYRFLKPALVAAGYRVVTMDLRGHGESSTGWADYSAAAIGADIVALLEHLNGGPAVVIGESIAAGSAVWAAAEAPGSIRGTILVGPFIRDIPPTFMQRIGLVFVTRSPSLWTAFYSMLYPSGKPADFAAYRKALKDNLLEPGRISALREMIASSRSDCEARIPEVRCPVLVIMGTADPDFADPAAEAALVADRLGGKVALIDGAGHYPQAEQPDATSPVIIDFLMQLDRHVHLQPEPAPTPAGC
jgi:pimeloyl-ACP methyl ester carboxylesterase